MIKKVLIANRAAIATRIIRTLKRLGITSVSVYAEQDRHSLHVRQADEAFSLGEGGAAETYLNQEAILGIAQQSGADAIHPGYGFLSENPTFVQACDQAGIRFIGPSAKHIEQFGLKHTARALAEQANIPRVQGSELLNSLEDALSVAEQIGYPIMLKSTAGGGGIGMKACFSTQELAETFQKVKHLSQQNFANDGVFIEQFIEHARHIEVQILGNGVDQVIAVGERDCSAQRRNQKVLEECPAPNLSEATRRALYQAAESLLSTVNYQNAGTVEFILDAKTQAFYFLEVNTRLQVEHGVTEAVYDVDLVQWMIEIAQNPGCDLQHLRHQKPSGHAIQARLYAEDPYKNFQPNAGLITHLRWPEREGLRIDHWIEAGIAVPSSFDPMLAKIIAHQPTRHEALQQLGAALNDTSIYGIETNLDYLGELINDEAVTQAKITTRYLDHFDYQPTRIDVLRAGTQTTIQDYPGRSGFWDIGVPPSGAFDSLSFRIGNQLLGNAEDAAGLEIIIDGPHFKFSRNTTIILTGATIHAAIDNIEVPMFQAWPVMAGQTLKLGKIISQGTRSYLCIAGGLSCPDYLGSKATFSLGQFGGHAGRALQVGDVLHYSYSATKSVSLDTNAQNVAPAYTQDWEIRVMYGPHGAPDFFTPKDIEQFFEHIWEVHYNSSRTGVRLIGPKPEWARKDGGEAGMHPSNIHDNAYAFGSVDFTGDMPVILGPDGPSLGGFVCPATVIKADLWKLGQLKAGHRLRFTLVDYDTALILYQDQQAWLTSLAPNQANEPFKPTLPKLQSWQESSPIIAQLEKEAAGETVTYRAAGDQFLLIEYGAHQLDIALRFRVHAVMQAVKQASLEGVLELTPGIRSLQIHFDAAQLSRERLLSALFSIESRLKDELLSMEVPSRIIHLPLSWDDPACQEAIKRYDKSVRADAPWFPSNIEFIRRINGLTSVQEVKDIVFSASYLVMGLGDVYLGAPVATPLDPRHRLVTTKYNPARTWTAENSVGIGGSYLCIYGMEGPGGYQFIGRTLQMWNRYQQREPFDQPWLLRFFDQIRFYEVTAEELADIRQQFPVGQYPIRIEPTTFSLQSHQAYLAENKTAITQFETQRHKAFEQELQRWLDTGQFHFKAANQQQKAQKSDWPESSLVISSPVSGSVWKLPINEGQSIKEGDTLALLESMKMEIPILADNSATIQKILVTEGEQIHAGQALIVLEETP
ncbi:MAG: urea carboxylase [Pseudomonadota bacterium]|nr:urea carboxylase [Pseudomonadota bacterium]